MSGSQFCVTSSRQGDFEFPARLADCHIGNPVLCLQFREWLFPHILVQFFSIPSFWSHITRIETGSFGIPISQGNRCGVTVQRKSVQLTVTAQ
jgi:hypothetical protein